jgi:hypothetical protein
MKGERGWETRRVGNRRTSTACREPRPETGTVHDVISQGVTSLQAHTKASNFVRHDKLE